MRRAAEKQRAAFAEQLREMQLRWEAEQANKDIKRRTTRCPRCHEEARTDPEINNNETYFCTACSHAWNRSTP